MNAGKQIGGPIATPIRSMVNNPNCDGVIFECKSERQAENTRYAAYMLKHRNGYSYKTMRRKNYLTVYKTDRDPFELHGQLRTRLS